MTTASTSSPANSTKSVSEKSVSPKSHAARLREAREIVALTLSIIRTPFGKMVPVAGSLDGKTEAEPA